MGGINNECDDKRHTLMQAHGRLVQKLSMLRDVSDLTCRLKDKFNRIDGLDDTMTNKILMKEDVRQKNIVDLFNDIADEMDVVINIIGNNTETSMEMID